MRKREMWEWFGRRGRWTELVCFNSSSWNSSSNYVSNILRPAPHSKLLLVQKNLSRSLHFHPCLFTKPMSMCGFVIREANEISSGKLLCFTRISWIFNKLFEVHRVGKHVDFGNFCYSVCLSKFDLKFSFNPLVFQSIKIQEKKLFDKLNFP